MNLEDETTAASQPLKLAHPYLELHLLLADGGEHWVPFERSRFTLGPFFAGGDQWSVALDGEQVRLSSEAGRALYQGVEVQEAALSVGDCLEIGSHRLWLMDARLPEFARLETCAGPRARCWSLKPQAYRLGRHGQARLNHIEVNHPTVSRAQATLLPMSPGCFGLLAESGSSPTRLNGNLLQVGKIERLRNGDLVQVGEVSLRFRQSGQAGLSPRLLRVESLGGFSLHWGEQVVSDTGWKSGKSRVLMARLALAWGQPLSCEYLMELLWPEHSAQRGRKNLSQCLSEVKATLGLSVEANLWLRTPSSLQLQPGFLGDHDAITFQELARGEEVSGWNKALQLYRGPYLPGLFDEWVLTTRRDLQLLAIETSQKLAQSLVQAGQFEQALVTARRGLSWDPCHQGLAQVMMESALCLDRPEEALRGFEAVRLQLERHFNIEPNTELVRAYLEARGRL